MAKKADSWSADLLLAASFLLAVSADQCTFSTTTNYKAPDVTVIESFEIKDYYNDCELLCYSNPSRCVAANVVAQPDDTYLCQFVSVVVKLEQLAALEANPGGKYIYRSAVVVDAVDVTKEGSGSSCAASSSLYGYPCENVLDGELTTEWKSNEDADSGAWIQIDLSSWYLITEVVLYRTRDQLGDVSREVRVYYKDEYCKESSDMYCPQYWQLSTVQATTVIVGPVITNFIKVEIMAVCDTNGNAGFREIQLFALTPTGV